jgi:hypothetical protein
LLRFIMLKGKDRIEKAVVIPVSKYALNVWSITVEFI